MKNGELFGQNFKLSEVRRIKERIKYIIENEYKMKKERDRTIFHYNDLQGEFTKQVLQSTPNPAPKGQPQTGLQDLKSYQFLKKKFNLNDNDVKQYAQEPFDKYLASKNIKINQETDISDEDSLDLDKLVKEMDVETGLTADVLNGPRTVGRRR
jgi:hypothetical protein